MIEVANLILQLSKQALDADTTEWLRDSVEYLL